VGGGGPPRHDHRSWLRMDPPPFRPPRGLSWTVPGHERFATNMLAGVGPVPAALLVVAADEGWAAQTEDHVRALHALNVSKGVLAVSRSDLADPSTTLAEAVDRLASTSLAGIPAVAVSAATGEGLDRLRRALDDLVMAMITPDPRAQVRPMARSLFRGSWERYRGHRHPAGGNCAPR